MTCSEESVADFIYAVDINGVELSFSYSLSSVVVADHLFSFMHLGKQTSFSYTKLTCVDMISYTSCIIIYSRLSSPHHNTLSIKQ